MQLSPALFLFLGIGISLAGFPRSPELKSKSKVWGSRLLQFSIVLLGAKIPIAELLDAGRTGLGMSLVSVALVLLSGLLLQRVFRIEEAQSMLISSGTAICGGSAIAAVAPTIRARNIDIGVSIAVVFLLNAVAMMVFPPVGHLFGLSDRQFAAWAALAIHDTSSVVGAAAQWSDQALNWATTIKLSRTLWIFPLVIFFSWLGSRDQAADGGPKPKFAIPWFIGGFLLASILSTFASQQGFPLPAGIAKASVPGFSASLFLIGASISREQLVKAGVRPLIYGIVLWLLTLTGSLAYVRLAL
jgi:uncharacterized integral membrane protein (TIGR00698 family)